MPPIFIWTPKAWVNLANIERAIFEDGTSKVTLRLADGTVVDQARPSFIEQLVQIIPADQGWECIDVAMVHDSEEVCWEIEPVIAWGLGLTGTLVPVTPRHKSGQFEPCWLRRSGSEMVYASDRSYENLEAALDDYRAQHH